VKYIDEFREQSLARKLAAAIGAAVKRNHRYRFMEFCGGHTHAIFRYGVQDLLPGEIEMVHGPGCPVCVLPVGRIDQAIALANQKGVILCTYADMLRVPGSNRASLNKARAAGADVRMVYSTLDAMQIARDNPDREVVFFAIGFETTAPPTAVAIRQASQEGLRNFSVFCNHVLTPAAIRSILDSSEAVPLDGFVGPAHVSTVIGTRAYECFAAEFCKPVVIAGFEPLDIMQAILMLVQQVNEGSHEVENEYARTVSRDGNRKAQQIMSGIFRLRPRFEWRGLGEVPESALGICEEYAMFDAEVRFKVEQKPAREIRGCECGAILRGLKKPMDCKLFGTICTPDNPMGSCMVSAEGSCAAYYSYGRFRNAA